MKNPKIYIQFFLVIIKIIYVILKIKYIIRETNNIISLTFTNEKVQFIVANIIKIKIKHIIILNMVFFIVFFEEKKYKVLYIKSNSDKINGNAKNTAKTISIEFPKISSVIFELL